MHTSLILGYAAVALITAMTPGAGVLYTVQNAMRYGKRTFICSPIGNASGVCFMSVLSATGMGALIAASPRLYVLLQAAGALVLIWMGVRSWRAKPVDIAQLSKNSEKTEEGKRHSENDRSLWQRRCDIYFSAALLQVSNPMLIVFLLSLFPQFIDAQEPYVPQVALLIAIFCTCCVLVHFVYSYTAATVAEKLPAATMSFWLNHVSAVLFWLMGAGVLVSIFRAGF